MPIYTQAGLQNLALRRGVTRSRAKVDFNRAIKSFDPTATYDIFLSHSLLDAEIVYALKLDIEEMGFSVYVDWVEDPQLDRSNVDKETAELLRVRMKSCASLLYATSTNAEGSKWMPWELGYFDGSKGLVAVVPVEPTNQQTDGFKGREYLTLYPYISKAPKLGDSQEALWVHEASTKYVLFDGWLKHGLKPKNRP